MLLLIIIQTIGLQAQTPQIIPDSLLKPVIAKLPCQAFALSVDEQGSVMVSCPEANCVYKFFGAKLDSNLRVGGKGVGGEAMSNPTEILVSNRLEAWVLDADNRRLLLLNPNLKVLRYVDFMNLDQQFPGRQLPDQLIPIAFAVTAASELFVLNLDDNMIYKFDPFMRYETRFGGTAYGAGSLQNPDRLLAGPNNTLYVLDSTNQTIQVFSNMGIFRHTLALKLPFRWQTACVYQNDLLLAGNFSGKMSANSHIVRYNLVSGQQLVQQLPNGHNIQDLWATYHGLYLLSKNQVFLYAN